MSEVGKNIALIRALGTPTDAQVTSAVEGWLDDHPEATTTVEDGSITNAKLASSFVTPGTASAYSSSATYAVGDYCFHNGSLYRCITAITTAEAWTAAHWTAAVLGDDVGDLKSHFNVFESNTFTPPTDYGKLIDASDCSTNKPDDLTITDTTNGILITKTGRVNATIYAYYNDIPTASAAYPVTYDFSITLSDSTGVDEVYFFDGNTEVGRYNGGAGTVDKVGDTYKIRYEYSSQTKLNWRFSLLYTFQSTKTITDISGININEPYKIVPATVDWYLENKYGAKFNAPSSGLKVEKTLDGMWSQGACAVGNYFVGFVAGADDHSTNGKMNIGLFSDMPNYEQANQNLGHCASADYDENTDTMLVGNGTTDPTIPPIVYLVKGASTVVANKSDVLYNGSNVVAIDMTGLDGGSCVACFGECNDIAYVVTGDTSTQAFANINVKYIYRCLLGKGSNNLQTAFASDSYGTFISGCADDEYNGTLHILNKYEIAFPGELQGLKYVNGNLLFPMDNNTNSILTSYLLFVKLQSTPTIDKILWIPVVSSTGTLVRTECEDVIFHNGKGYVLTNTTIGSSHIYKTHVFNYSM